MDIFESSPFSSKFGGTMGRIGTIGVEEVGCVAAVVFVAVAAGARGVRFLLLSLFLCLEMGPSLLGESSACLFTMLNRLGIFRCQKETKQFHFVLFLNVMQ